MGGGREKREGGLEGGIDPLRQGDSTIVGGAEAWVVGPPLLPPPRELYPFEPQFFPCERGSRTDPARLTWGFEPRVKVKSREPGTQLR